MSLTARYHDMPNTIYGTSLINVNRTWSHVYNANHVNVNAVGQLVTCDVSKIHPILWMWNVSTYFRSYFVLTVYYAKITIFQLHFIPSNTANIVHTLEKGVHVTQRSFYSILVNKGRASRTSIATHDRLLFPKIQQVASCCIVGLQQHSAKHFLFRWTMDVQLY